MISYLSFFSIVNNQCFTFWFSFHLILLTYIIFIIYLFQTDFQQIYLTLQLACQEHTLPGDWMRGFT